MRTDDLADYAQHRLDWKIVQDMLCEYFVQSYKTASAAGSKGYTKKCAIGAIAGIVIACAYIILRNLLDIKIRSSEELVEKYNIPVLGNIPNYEIKNTTRVKTIDEPYVSKTPKGDE